MSDTHPPETHKLISDWLEKHPYDPLVIAAGYVSVWGINWLAERTGNRSVTLIIGDITPSRFERATIEHFQAVQKFLAQPFVKVRNWRRVSSNHYQQWDMAHLKAWLTMPVDGTLGSALIGSANLSELGMHHNWEMMAIVSDRDLPRIYQEVGKGLMQTARDCKEEIIANINNGFELAKNKSACFDTPSTQTIITLPSPNQISAPNTQIEKSEKETELVAVSRKALSYSDEIYKVLPAS